MASSKRTLVIKPLEGKLPKTSTGMVDSRVFAGGNSMYASMDPQTCMWVLRYEQGVIPQPLQGMFTSFAAAKKHAEDYLRKRNCQIVEVINAATDYN
jgi:hypothetical protein